MQSVGMLRSLWFFALSLWLVLIVSPLLRHGMFLDGIIYAAIAKNLSEGLGSLWQPYYSQSHFSTFYEHPPLAIYFQSLFFKLFGSGFLTERLYSFLMATGQCMILSLYWLKKNKNHSFLSVGLLLLLWLLIPLNHIVISNMLENTLSLFSTLAVFVLLIHVHTNFALVCQYMLAAAVMLIAFLCNGPTALFPIALPFFSSLILHNSTVGKAIGKSIFLAFAVGVVFMCFYVSFPEALMNTKRYFQQQLLASIVGDRQPVYTGFKHLNIILLYLRAYWIVTIFSLFIVGSGAKIAKQRPVQWMAQQARNPYFLLFFILSLISSLPVGVSHRQAFSYIMQSAPFYTLAMMFFCFESFSLVTTCGRNKRFLVCSTWFSTIGLILSVFITLYSMNGYNRQKEMIEDIQFLISRLQFNEVLSASPRVYNEWYTEAYFARDSHINITDRSGEKYYIALKNESLPFGYRLMNLPLHFYCLAYQDPMVSFAAKPHENKIGSSE